MERRGYQYQLPQSTGRREESRSEVELIAEYVESLTRENRMLDEGCMLIEESFTCNALYPDMWVETAVEGLSCKGEVERFLKSVPKESRLSGETDAPRQILEFLTHWWKTEKIISRHDQLQDASGILIDRRMGNADLILRFSSSL